MKKLLPSPLGADNLQINLDEYICERFDNGEHILFSSDVMKQNWTQRWQVKNFLLTNRNMYYLNEDLEIKKSHKLTDIIALTVKQDDDLTDKYDFMVHIKNESDYMFYSKHREEIITCLRSAYFMITETNLPIYEVSMKIDKYRTRKNAP